MVIGIIARQAFQRAAPFIVRGVAAIGKQFVKAPVKTTLLSGGALLTVGAITRRPEILLKIPRTTKSIVDIGGDVAQLSGQPSAEGFKQFIKEHPIATGGALLGAGLIVGKAIGPFFAGAQTGQLTEAVEKLPEQFKKEKEVVPAGAIAAVPETTSPIVSQPSQLRAVSRLRKKKPNVQNIRQSVRIQIANQNRNINKVIRSYA